MNLFDLKFSFDMNLTLLRQVLIPTLVTIANNLQMSSNFIWGAIRTSI